jgi:GTPase KRas protein
MHIVFVIDTTRYSDNTRHEQYYRSGQGFLLIYSITDRSSFESISNYLQQIIRTREDEDIPMILIGNKLDLNDERTVSYEEGKELAKDCNIHTFMETSAKTDVNITEAFHQIVLQCIQKTDRWNAAYENQRSTTQNKKNCSLM